jgi:hypothetical protein
MTETEQETPVPESRRALARIRATLDAARGAWVAAQEGWQHEPYGSPTEQALMEAEGVLHEAITDLGAILERLDLPVPDPLLPEDEDVPEDEDDQTQCAGCGAWTTEREAHLHQGRLIGECCWDERLRATE